MLTQVKKIAAEKGTTLCELEIKCGLSKGSISHWDDIKPSYDKVIRVAKELGVSVEELTNNG